jgi:hypothetical protein
LVVRIRDELYLAEFHDKGVGQAILYLFLPDSGFGGMAGNFVTI